VEDGMIARLWHGTTRAEHSDDYLAYLHETGIPGYRATEGNRSVQILRRIDGPVAHFLVISYWESFEAIGRFAGEEMEKAVYYPRDREFLLEFEPNVTHYEVAAQA
jgi:heme-degrading monooxygenase HmoA